MALAPGTYAIDTGRVNPDLPTVSVTVPDGWHALDGWILNRPRPGEAIPPVSVQFWDVDEVYSDPCQWAGTLFDPGPSADDLAAALADVDGRDATQPTDVTLDGFSGKYLELTVPDIDQDAEGNFTDCNHDFRSWTSTSGGTRYHQGPGQIDRVWIMVVEGGRLVIDAFSMPYATSAELGQLMRVVESIEFGQ